MEKIKTFFKWIASNKKSLISTIVGAAGAGLGVTAAWTIDAIPDILVSGFDIAPILYTVICVACFVLNELGICGKGFESVKAYIERKAAEKAAAEALAIEREAQRQLEAEQAELRAIELEARRQIEEDARNAEKRDAEAARAELIARKKQEILARESKK